MRRIFAEFVAGESLRGICHRLNADGIKSPRGKGWAVSALRSLVLNPIYKGLYVWNRSEWIKDHDTGTRKRIERPESEWLSMEDEGWRIVEPEVWQAAHDDFDRRSGKLDRGPDGRLQGKRVGSRSNGKRVLAGVFACGECGGGFYPVNHRCGYCCSWHRDRGEAVCGNGLIVPKADLEARFFETIRDEVLTDDTVEYAVERAEAHVRKALANADDTKLDATRDRIAKLVAEIENLAELTAKTGQVDVYARLITDRETERRGLEDALRRATAAPVDFGVMRSSMVERVREVRGWFVDAGEDARRALRLLLGDRRLSVHHDDEYQWRIEGFFEVPGISLPAARSTLEGERATGRVSVVAGAGFEPATSGL